MTSPAGGVSEISTQIATIQATIAALSAPAATKSPAASKASFASAYSAALADSPAPATGVSSVSATGAYGASELTGADVVKRAETYLGVPYVWGGESRSGIDCSGLVQATYHSLGINLPRVAADQQHSGRPVASLAQAQPGDLLFFGDPAYHVAIYLGHNQLIESPEPGKTVHITDVYQTPTSIRRIIPTGGSTSVGGLSATQLVSAGINSAVARYADEFARAEARHHLPTGMLAAVAQQESGGNPAAVSPAGAEGLMQLMPATAAGQGVDPFNPTQAINAAARILAGNLAQFGGSVPLALAAYNAGAGAVAKYGGIPPYSETQNYVRSITAMMAAGG